MSSDVYAVPTRTIAHVDMDAFYASIEERDDPTLVGKPLIVGGSSAGRGVVAAANYIVRRFGVHSAMPTATALRLCPQAIVLPPRMEHYAAISRGIRELFFRYTPLVEPLSLDEAFLDLTGSAHLFGTPHEVARRVKAEILSATGLVASVGVAPNKFLAKIASDLDKPDGIVIVTADGVTDFLEPLPIGRLWGVGRVTSGVFDRLGVKTIGDLSRLDDASLARQFGSAAAHFGRLSRGLDDRPVIPDRAAKSISHETTFAVDIDDVDVLRAWLLELTEHVARRVRRHQFRGRTVQLKIRFDDFRTITRSRTMTRPTDVTHEIWLSAAELLGSSLPGSSRGIRLLGVGLTNLVRSGLVQQTLFDEQDHVRQRGLDAATDAIRERFGVDSVTRATNLQHHTRHAPLPPKPGDPSGTAD